MTTTQKVKIHLSQNDGINIRLSTLKVKRLIKRRDGLLNLISYCGVTDEAEVIVKEHDDVLLALVKMN